MKTLPEQPETAAPANDATDVWAISTIGMVCEINPPKPKRGIAADTQPVTFVSMPAIVADSGTIKSPVTPPYTDVAKGFMASRDENVIMAKSTPCMENGKAAIARGLPNGPGFGSTESHVLRSRGDSLPEFIYYFIRQEPFTLAKVRADKLTQSMLARAFRGELSGSGDEMAPETTS